MSDPRSPVLLYRTLWYSDFPSTKNEWNEGTGLQSDILKMARAILTSISWELVKTLNNKEKLHHHPVSTEPYKQGLSRCVKKRQIFRFHLRMHKTCFLVQQKVAIKFWHTIGLKTTPDAIHWSHSVSPIFGYSSDKTLRGCTNLTSGRHACCVRNTILSS